MSRPGRHRPEDRPNGNVRQNWLAVWKRFKPSDSTNRSPSTSAVHSRRTIRWANPYHRRDPPNPPTDDPGDDSLRMTPGMLIVHGAVSRRLRNLAQSRSSLYAALRSPAQGKRETAGTDRYGPRESSHAESIEPPWVVANRRDPRGRVPAPLAVPSRDPRDAGILESVG